MLMHSGLNTYSSTDNCTNAFLLAPATSVRLQIWDSFLVFLKNIGISERKQLTFFFFPKKAVKYHFKWAHTKCAGRILKSLHLRITFVWLLRVCFLLVRLSACTSAHLHPVRKFSFSLGNAGGARSEERVSSSRTSSVLLGSSPWVSSYFIQVIWEVSLILRRADLQGAVRGAKK